jgi:hypothetical protein
MIIKSQHQPNLLACFRIGISASREEVLLVLSRKHFVYARRERINVGYAKAMSLERYSVRSENMPLDFKQFFDVGRLWGRKVCE